MKNRTLWIVVGLVAIVAIITALTSHKSEDNEIRLGAVLPLTGKLAPSGVGAQQGMSLAVDKINDAGGIKGKKIVVIYEDSKGQPADGVSAARKLMDVQNINVIFTSLTGVSRAISPLVSKGKAIQVVYAMDETIPLGSQGVIRIYPGIREEGRTLLEYAKRVNPRRVAIVHFKQAALDAEVSEVLDPGLKAMGAKTIIEEFEDTDAATLRNIATRFRSFGPQMIFVCAYYNQILPIYKTFTENGLNRTSEFVSGLNFSMAADQGMIPASMLNNTVAAVPVFAEHTTVSRASDSVTKTFRDSFKRKFGKAPDLDAACGYDALLIVAQAIEKSGMQTGTLNNTLRATKDFKGVTGKISVDTEGNSHTGWELVRYTPSGVTPLGQAQPK